jgi:hypothetical protein
MNAVGKRNLLYVDTDSIVFVSRRGETPAPPLCGNFVGDLTNEVEKSHGADAYIRSFVAIAPKMYGMEICRRSADNHPVLETYVKAKGVVMTHDVCEKINFHSFRDLLTRHYRWFKDTSVEQLIADSELSEPLTAPLSAAERQQRAAPFQTVTYPTFRTCDREGRKIFTRKVQKRVSACFDKRKILPAPERVTRDGGDGRDAADGVEPEEDRLLPSVIETAPLGYRGRFGEGYEALDTAMWQSLTDNEHRLQAERNEAQRLEDIAIAEASAQADFDMVVAEAGGREAYYRDRPVECDGQCGGICSAPES